MGFLFENLEVYKKAIGFAKDVQLICKDIKRGNYVLVDQLQRAALSISTNIAEGNGRWHKKDRAHFFIIARGSAFECAPLLEICSELELIPNSSAASLK
ncbi:MAG TPA: four helix bundle protein, partial [Anaerolineae bacterium]|nr:four helix bundle protein [Anaerolineae bacterium]